MSTFVPDIWSSKIMEELVRGLNFGFPTGEWEIFSIGPIEYAFRFLFENGYEVIATPEAMRSGEALALMAMVYDL
jgi:hypothetical protein